MSFNYRRRIYLSDTDAAGVVYFAQGLAICHEAYEESLSKAGICLNQMIREGIAALPIIHGEIDFFRPMCCGDRIQISLNTSLTNDSEFAIAYSIFPIDNIEQILVTAQTKHVCINPAIRQRIKLPAAIRAWSKNN